MALRSRSAYVPVAVTPRHDRLGSNKIRLKRKTRTGRTLLGKDVAHELSLPADPATRSEFQDFFKRISGSANKTIAIMQELCVGRTDSVGLAQVLLFDSDQSGTAAVMH
eukprot:scaffold8152_cov390-Prasinococcus_capsulatus_cf.AAC.3